ncbi:hypothetical protein FIM12_05625 [SAR202 cluster bacterium AD-804-J14_MRT_500m]|nr:hypothetical protein [SAR202 cluster bacterium AD-804-J14_MRT_500m]
MTRIIVGTDDYTFEMVRPWGTLPAGMSFGTISHVAVDSADRVYVYHRGDPPVVVFDTDGNYLSSWGSGVIADAHGIYMTPDDDLFMVDRDVHEVIKFTLDGKPLLRLGQREKPALQAPFNHPTDVAVAPNGDIYVSDGYANSCVHRFDAEGKYILSWGSPGADSGQFTTPHGIWAPEDGRIYVTDRENNRVQVFSPEGDYLDQWSVRIGAMDIFMDPKGNFFVTDQTPGFTVFDRDGTIVTRARTFENAHGLWGDSKGNMYLAPATIGGLMTKLIKQ